MLIDVYISVTYLFKDVMKETEHKKNIINIKYNSNTNDDIYDNTCF